MIAIKRKLDNEKLKFSLSGGRRFTLSWEISELIKSSDFLCDLYDANSVNGLKSLNDYYIYLLSLKLLELKEYVPTEEWDDSLESLYSDIDNISRSITARELITFINCNIIGIFEDEDSSYDIRKKTIDYIVNYQKGIDDAVFRYLASKHGHIYLTRFDEFEKKLEANPDLLNLIIPTGSFNEVQELRFSLVLDIFEHILLKKSSNLKNIVQNKLDYLYEDMMLLPNIMDTENIYLLERESRKFYEFLVKVKDVKANTFLAVKTQVAQKADESIVANGALFSYEIPVGEVVEKWEKTNQWEYKLLQLTHDIDHSSEDIDFKSRLAKQAEVKSALIDLISTNIPTDDHYPMSYQQWLSTMDAFQSGFFFNILKN